MKLQMKIAIVTGVLALSALPVALAMGETTYTPSEPPAPQGPKHALPSQAKAYGVYCRGKSKKHVKGEKGTEFSRCIAEMRNAANHPNKAPGQVCKGKSKEHVKGEKGTEFSRCVKLVNELRKEEREKEREAA